MDEKKPLTHVFWIPRWKRGKFCEWHQAGHGRIETDEQGNFSAYSFQHITVLGGWNGQGVLLPIGQRPKDPQPQATRPTGLTQPDDEPEE